jgi:deoxyribodipyrimidine photo-lyase
VYTHYNLDPSWHKDLEANRILLLEPSHFDQYPVSASTIDFVLKLAKNISGMQVFAGEFDALLKLQGSGDIMYKEHPFNQHFRGVEDPRDWMFTLSGYFPSFFAFWNKAKKEIRW